MGFEYVYVDSKDRKYHETKSEMLVNLTHPIHHCKNVRLVSFSCANEFHNVIDGNTSFSVQVHNLQTNQRTAIINYVLGAGFYSLTEMITQLNALFLANPISEATTTTTLTLTLLANGKVSLQILGSGTNTDKRATLYYPRNGQFQNSIAHRLGFSRGQVFDDPNLTITKSGSIVTVFYTNSQNKSVSIEESLWDGALIWTTTSTTIALNTKTSAHIGYEARCPYLFVKSDLVSDFHTTHRDNKTDQVFTKQDNILQKIENNVNIYSYLHYRSSLTECFVHELSGAKPVTHFTISLTDDLGNLLEGDSFRNFSCVLLFETHENIATTKLNEQVIEANQRSIFLSNHNC